MRAIHTALLNRSTGNPLSKSAMLDCNPPNIRSPSTSATQERHRLPANVPSARRRRRDRRASFRMTPKSPPTWLIAPGLLPGSTGGISRPRTARSKLIPHRHHHDREDDQTAEDQIRAAVAAPGGNPEPSEPSQVGTIKPGSGRPPGFRNLRNLCPCTERRGVRRVSAYLSAGQGELLLGRTLHAHCWPGCSQLRGRLQCP